MRRNEGRKTQAEYFISILAHFFSNEKGDLL